MLPTSRAVLYLATGLAGVGRVRCSSMMRFSGVEAMSFSLSMRVQRFPEHALELSTFSAPGQAVGAKKGASESTAGEVLDKARVEAERIEALAIAHEQTVGSLGEVIDVQGAQVLPPAGRRQGHQAVVGPFQGREDRPTAAQQGRDAVGRDAGREGKV